MSFYKKIFFANLTLLILLMAILFPFLEKTVTYILQRSFRERIETVGKRLQDGANIDEAVRFLAKRGGSVFLRINVIDANGTVLYQNEPVEVDSKKKKEEFSAIDYPFNIGGDRYILRIGFPVFEMQEFAADFEIGFVCLGVAFLLLYSAMTWLIVKHFCQPIQQIINAILPYQQGREEFLPHISIIDFPTQGDEFSKLAYTLNSLSERVQKEIEHLRQQRMETEGILESLREGIIALNPYGKVSFTNKAACEMLRAPHNEIVGQSLDEIATKKLELARKSHELVVHVLQTSEPIVQAWTEDSGSRLHLNLIAAPLAYQNGVLLVLQDTTSEYKVLDMGKDFIANASHELRTPITVIRGFAETLQDLPHLSPKMLEEITGKIVRTCIRLDKLVKSLLTLSDIENHTVSSFQRINLIPLIENCISFILTAHRGAEIDFASDVSQLSVRADPDLLDLAITNLLDNAVKYSPSPAQIKIEICVHEGEVILEVQDHGIGIPPNDIPHIFDRFYTVDKARSRKSGGAGLGLSIVKTIIEKHRGRISVVSEAGKGSRFIISLPFSRSR